jgi:hypothetical protein
MNNFIDDRKAACDAMKKWAPELHAACAVGDSDALQASELFLAGWDAANARGPQWIPCSERMPEVGQDIVAICKKSFFKSNTYPLIDEEDVIFLVRLGMSHWMPLPPPPEDWI